MGLTDDYLRYVPAGVFNIISNETCNAVFVTLQGQVGRFVAVGASEHIIIWDLRLGEKAQVLPGENAVVTAICANPNNKHLAAGYSNGNVSIYDLKSAEAISTFAGHKSEVTTLCYDLLGQSLASGSKDTDVIVWDTVAEKGICRFSGHRGPITKVAFMSDVLISSSRDTFVKFWDLKTQHCFKTLTGHGSEVWGFSLVKDNQFLVTGSSSPELKVYRLHSRDVDQLDPVQHLAETLELACLEDGDDSTHPLQCVQVGSLLRETSNRVISLISDSTGQVLGCHGPGKTLDLFYFCSGEEADLRLRKRLKKKRKNNEPTDEGESHVLSLSDLVKRLKSVNVEGKPKSLDLVLGNGGELRVVVNFKENCLRLYNLQTSVKDADAVCLRGIVKQGHHSHVNAVAFSSDNLAIISGSCESVKLWNRPSQACVRTIETGVVQAVVFVPGDRHVLAGLNDGKLLIIDVMAGDVLEEIPAHTESLTDICLTPDLRGCVTAGHDQTVKFWQFELIVDEKSQSKVKVLSLLHNKTLKLENKVTCVKLSPNGKFVAVGLMDSTVKIFFADSFRFFLSLYGHAAPVHRLDISSDSRLIATGSDDKNIKIWGMDFGDCIKSIFAHDGAITGLQFVPKTHYLFSCGTDGSVKQWDADKFKKIITLRGHSGKAHSLTVSPNGQYVVSCGSDHALRLYEKSEQLVVLQDEEEEERERQEEEELGKEAAVVPGQPGLNLPSKRTVGSLKAAESILECLEVCDQYKEQLAQDKNADLPLLMRAFRVISTDDFLLETLKRIRSSDLEEALTILPFKSVCDILNVLPDLIARGDCTELTCNVAVFLLQLHNAPILANKLLLPVLEKLSKVMSEQTRQLRDLVGYNYYGLLLQQDRIEKNEGVRLFRDATAERKDKNRKRRKKEKLKRSIMMLNA